MPDLSSYALAVGITLASVNATAQPQASECRVPAFRGAASPQGADAEMHVVNTGRPCSIANFGMAGERQSPAFGGQITRAPSNGTATFQPPRAHYVPKAEYSGEDYFEYEANAKGNGENTVILRVRVKVFVKLPQQ